MESINCGQPSQSSCAAKEISTARRCFEDAKIILRAPRSLSDLGINPAKLGNGRPTHGAIDAAARGSRGVEQYSIGGGVATRSGGHGVTAEQRLSVGARSGDRAHSRRVGLRRRLPRLFGPRGGSMCVTAFNYLEQIGLIFRAEKDGDLLITASRHAAI